MSEDVTSCDRKGSENQVPLPDSPFSKLRVNLNLQCKLIYNVNLQKDQQYLKQEATLAAVGKAARWRSGDGSFEH